MTNILAAWRATFTRRWHRHPELAETCDPIGGHQGRVALLAMLIFPESYPVHLAAVLHDMGEVAVGDIPKPVKNANPDLQAVLDRIEAEAMVAMGLPVFDLEPVDALKLRLCDKLDAILWARHHRPELLAEPGWRADIAEVCDLLWRTGKGHMVPWARGLA